MATTVYVTVAGRGTIAQVERYVGFGAEVTNPGEHDGKVFAILRVTDDEERRARSNAQWNADRLASGLYGTQVVDTLAEAQRIYQENVDLLVR